MSDVKDILGLNAAGASPKKPKEKAAKKKKLPKGTGLKRELLALHDGWDNHGATIIPTEPIKQVFAQKRDAKARWVLESIKSTARQQSVGKTTDDLQLKHWVKITGVPDYRYAKFNKQVKMLNYTDEEYQAFLQNPEWTREETDRLMDLCLRFDLRFLVIFDQFISQAPYPEPSPPKSAWAIKAKAEAAAAAAGGAGAAGAGSGVKMEPGMGLGGQSSSGAAPMQLEDDEASAPVQHSSRRPVKRAKREKTCEDLKARFYTIQAALMQARNASDPELKKNPLFKNQFDPVYETERKAQLNRLFKRTKEEEVKMAEITLENRKLSAALKKVKGAGREKKVKAVAAPAAMVRQQSAEKKGAPAPKKEAAFRPMVYNAGDSGPMAPMPASCLVDVRTVAKPRPDGAFLRSSQIQAQLNLSVRQIKVLETELSSLGFKKSNILTVPSQANAQLWDQLRTTIISLNNLQKYVKKKEDEVAAGLHRKKAGAP